MQPIVHFDSITEDGSAFAARCERAAGALKEAGIGPGTVVALMLHNEPVLLELMLAARTLGAHYCLINWHFKSAEVRHVLSDSGAQLLIAHANLIEQVRDGIPTGVRVFVASPLEGTRKAFGIAASIVPALDGMASWEAYRDAVERAPVAPDRPGSVMVYTSGTTGLPKGIKRAPPTPAQVEQLAETTRVGLGIAPGMRALISAPMYHSAPSSYVMQAALLGAELWLAPRFDAEDTLRLIDANRITHAYLVPTMFSRLLRLPPEVRARYDLRSLRFVASTGAPCPIDVKLEMIKWFGPVIHECYAASELGWITHIDSEEALRKPGSVGRALPGTVLKVLSDQGQVLLPGAVGLIHARQSAVPDFSYANNDSARQALERNGLWTLRDMGYLDDDGYLFIVDRQTDMVISGGVNIYPAEIEAVLATLPGLADCAVFGIPDDDFGESLLAAVQSTPGTTLSIEQVQAHVRERMAGYKVPRKVVFVEQMPREDTGKIFKRKLRDPYWEGRTRRV